MQRRTLLTGLATAAMSGPWTAIGHTGPAGVQDDGTDAAARQDPTLSLIPVVERLPQALAEQRSPEHDEHFPFPLVIGLGEAAQGLIEQLGRHARMPPAAALYRSGLPTQAGQAPWLQQRLALCESALLLIDTADPRALGEGLVWARQLLAHQVSLRAALLLNTTTAAVPEGWRRYAGQPAWDTAHSHAGRGSVKLVANGLADGMGVAQVIEYDQPDTRPIIVGGWSRAEGVDSSGDYSVYLDVFYADGTPWWGKTAEWPRGTHDWAYAASVYQPAKPVKRIEVYVLLRKCQGTAWVDDVFVDRGGLRVTGLSLQRDTPRHPRQVQFEATLSAKADWQAELADPDGNRIATANGRNPACRLAGEVPVACTSLTVAIRGRDSGG
ncbi:MAG: hypothetical protein EOM91_17110, partial [Sphingobacteriia bacterium]|nr:hypothetical protein [Sphingobacteriia bacterium]